MKNIRLPKDFFLKSALEVAPKLLGKLLCRKIRDKTIKITITETEAYVGENDTACHAHKGKTKRTEPMYEAGGITYIYLCYGIYNLLNIVTGKKEFPEAVLIRGVNGYNGPGKLTKALSIDNNLNFLDLSQSNKLWIEDSGVKINYFTSPRIGIGYASDYYRNICWRFILKG